MSDAIGPMSVSASQEEVFLGQEIAREKEHSEATAETVDKEVRKLITGIEAEVEKRLKENRDRLDKLVERLLEKETLEAKEISSLLDRGDKDKEEKKEERGREEREGKKERKQRKGRRYLYLKEYGDHRELRVGGRRQHQMCVRNSVPHTLRCPLKE
jgi:hypothetical protein